MSEYRCSILNFLTLVEGDWRNAVFIDACRPAVCTEESPCDGYLFTTDRRGAPVLIPVGLFRQLTGEPVDPSECSGRLSCSGASSERTGSPLRRCLAPMTCGAG